MNLNTLLEQILQDLHATIEKSSAKIEFEHLPIVMGDAVQLRQLFQNLLSNAMKYRKELPPHIQIQTKEEDRNWVFSVKDNGIGIAKKNLTKIFEVFQKLHSHDKYEGTGIGLASCKRIVNNHQGEIWIESELGKGSTFFFTIAKDL